MQINAAGKKLEQTVLGMVVSEPELAKLAKVLLSPDDFQQPACRRTFELAMQMLANGHSVDQLELMNRVAPEDLPMVTSSLAAFSEVLAPVSNGERTIRALQKYSDLAFGTGNLQSILSDIQAKKIHDPVDLATHLKNVSEQLLLRHKRETAIPMPTLIRLAMDRQAKDDDKIYFGLEPIDSATGGIFRRELITIAARTGIGKSALCLHPLVKTGIFDDKTVIYFSTEMDSTRLTRRLLANVSGVSQAKLKQEVPMTDRDIETLARITPLVHESRIQFIDQIKFIDEIENSIQIEIDGGVNVRLIVVDYIQMLHIRDYRKSRQQELSEISEALLRIARRHDLTVISVAQLSREAVKAKNGVNRWAEPDLSQIKDCGSIEQDSDRVLLLWQDQHDEHLTHCHLAKNREGRRAYFDLKFFGGPMRFYPISPYPSTAQTDAEVPNVG